VETHQSDGRSALGSKDLVFFEILRDSKCTRCSKVLSKGEFLFLDGEQALCLSCADFDHLEYLRFLRLSAQKKNASAMPNSAARRGRSELRRAEQDHDLVARMTGAILKLFPGCPSQDAQAIAAHTAARGSGRVGRTSAGRALETEALTNAVVAAIRHNHTRYDQLLTRGWRRIDARDAVRDVIERVMESWRSSPGRR